MDDPFVHLTGDEDRDRAFAVVAEHLAPGGRFVLDAAWFPPEDREDAAEGLVKEQSVQGGRLCVREVWHCDPDTRLCTARFEYRQDGGSRAGPPSPAVSGRSKSWRAAPAPPASASPASGGTTTSAPGTAAPPRASSRR